MNMAVTLPQQLLNVLTRVKTPKAYCVSGLLPTVRPRLEIGGLGPITLPLTKRQAKELIKRARQAPYGKGTETLVDTKVRRVWEIDADQVSFSNRLWAETVGQAVQSVQSKLGLGKQTLQAHLYKLLLYEAGSFFLPHRDGEKLDRMVATLVITLPSPHEGGELVIRQNGQDETIDFAPDSEFCLQFAAFYADCEHEVKPVQSGFRLSLVYNLVLEKSHRRKITAPSNNKQIDAVAKIFAQWPDQHSWPVDGVPVTKWAVLFDHQYTQDGLSINTLKGSDRLKASILFAAAQKAGFDAALALVTYWEHGEAEPTFTFYSYDRHNDYDDDGNEESDEYDDEHIMGHVYERTWTAEHFSDATGRRLNYCQIPLSDQEIIAEIPFDAQKADEEDFEDYTGNAGMTLQRWYRRAGIVVWPSTRRFSVLCEAGVASSIEGLRQSILASKRANTVKRAEIRNQCREFAAKIISIWPERSYGFFGSDAELPKDSFLPLLEQLDDAGLASAWFQNVLMRDAMIEPGKSLGNICQQHGWQTFATELNELFDSTSNESLARNARILSELSCRKDKCSDRQILCVNLAKRMVDYLEQWRSTKIVQSWRAKMVDLSGLLSSLLRALVVLDREDLLSRLVAYVSDEKNGFDLTKIQVPVLLRLQKWLKVNAKGPSSSLRRWMNMLRGELESRISQPPRKPADFRREFRASCRCADCKVLRSFLEDPLQETLRFPLAKERRRHLHSVININQLDTTHVTEHRGSPHTLVCKKTTASYKRALAAHKVDLDQLEKIQTMSKDLGLDG